MSYRRALILAVMDVLLLAELTTAIWWGHLVPEEISWRFLQVFLPLAALTILGTRLAFKRWAPKQAAPAALDKGQTWRPVNLFGALGNVKEPGRRD